MSLLCFNSAQTSRLINTNLCMVGNFSLSKFCWQHLSILHIVSLFSYRKREQRHNLSGLSSRSKQSNNSSRNSGRPPLVRDVHKRFFKNPYQLAQQLFQQSRSGLSAQKEELEIHLKKTYSDPDREIPVSESAGLVWPAARGEKLNNNPPNLEEIRAVVQKTKAKSAPEPNVLRQLHKILREAWSNLKISEQ